MTATASSSAPRYAPEDPTLPKPWKGLIDGSTAYLYYWNPETNVTQYERPVASQPPVLPPPPPLLPNPPKSAPVAVNSSVQLGGPGHGQHRDSQEEDRQRSGSRSHQHQGSRSTGVHSQNGHSAHSSRSSARGHGSSDVGGGSSTESYRRQHEITVTGDNIPPPLMTFESTGFPSEILKEVQRAGFSFPTPIQAQSWPIALQNRDLVAIAKTGSGKTLGYLIPGFIHIKHLRNNSRMGPTVLVLAPTRELATQIQDEAAKFGKSSRISCTCLYGGAAKGPQLRDVDRGVDVVVATPGRLNDILEMKRVSLRQVSYLVLDEADRMLDMGFEPQIRKIVKEIPDRRQTLMFTATWPKEVRKIAADLLIHPAQVNIGSIDELVANKAITQYVEVIKSTEKQRRLEQILRSQEPGSKVLIFCSTKRMCDQLARSLTRQFGASAIHGDKSQGERDYVLSQFRTGRSPILVATDVAARGLDIKDIRVVVNYDFPTGVEDYVHRIGRTGRAGATGVAYTFFCDQDAKYAKDLVKVLDGADQRVPSELRDMASRGGYGKARNRWGSGSSGRDGGRSLGGQSDGRGGRGLPPSSGRLESGRGGHEETDRDRYDRNVRGRKDSADIWANGERRAGGRGLDRSHGRSRSRSPNKGYGRLGNSHSRSPNKGYGKLDNSRSRSRSRSRNRAHIRSSSRSRSHSLDRQGGGAPARGLSSLPNRDPSSNNQMTHQDDHSPHPQQQRSPYNANGPKETVGSGCSPSPQRDRSRSPKSIDRGRPDSGSPGQQQQMSPCPGGDDVEGPGNDPVRPSPPQYRAVEEEEEEEEEEGMIPADEDGIIPPEASRNSPRSAKSD